MAALAGATVATHAEFRPDNYVDPSFHGPSLAAPVWLAFVEVVPHGPATVHTFNKRGTLDDTDVETAIAELDQYTNVAVVNPTDVDISAAIKGLFSAIGLQGKAFPGAGGHSTTDEAMLQHGDALMQYHDETALDLLPSLTNASSPSSILTVEAMQDIKIAFKAQNPRGSIYNAILHVSDFGNFVKDLASLGNNLADQSSILATMKVSGYEGTHEGVNFFSTSRVDQIDANNWGGAIVAGVAFDPTVYSQGANMVGGMGVTRSSGLIHGPIRRTVVEFLGRRMADLTSDQRLGDQMATYTFEGIAIINNAQGRKWTTLKVAA